MNPLLNPLAGERFEVNTNDGTTRHIMEAAALMVRRALKSPFSGGGQKLHMPMDPSVNDDDPLARLERDSGVEGDLAVVSRTARDHTISIEDAYAWLRISNLAKSIWAGERGIAGEEDLDEADELTLSTLKLLNFISWNITIALDPEIDPELHPELYEGLES